MITGYVGSYSQGGGDGIYRFELDDKSGELKGASAFSPIKNSKYIIAGDNGDIYSVYGTHNNHGVAVCTASGKITDAVAFDSNTPCHITAVAGNIYTANYNSGAIAKLSFIKGRLTLINKIDLGENSGCHQVIVADNMLIVPALLYDKLYLLDFDLNMLGRIAMPTKSGPRHGVVSQDNKSLYMVSELSCELWRFDIKGYSLKKTACISLLPDGTKGVVGTAAIRMSSDEKKLFISTRNLNIITVVDISCEELKIVQHYNLPGDHPRDILNVAQDRFLLVANRYSDELLSLHMDDGIIKELCSTVKIPQGVSILTE